MIIQITQVATPPAPSFASGLIATAGGQGGALPLPARVNVVASVPAGCGVLLAAIAGNEQKVLNVDPANPLPVFPPIGCAIFGSAANTAVNVAAVNGHATFNWDGNVTWYPS